MEVEELNSLSDAEIINSVIQTRDNKALSVLYDRYAESIFRKCFAIVHDTEIAKDLTHDILLKAFLKLKELKNKNSFKFWLNRMAYNHCIDYLRLRKSKKTDRLNQEYEIVSDLSSEKEEKILKEIQLEQLEELLKKLNEQDRLILMMHYQDEMSVKEMQEILNLGASAIKMRLKRAREKLVVLFQEHTKLG